MTFAQEVRETELDQVVRLFPDTGRVLEIGAGAGWQARVLQQRGFDVSVVDVEQSNYRDIQIFPVANYDGKTLPFDDGQFQVVFSSNVLEHIADIELALAEQARVLSKDGIAVHVVPSATWRLWSSLGHYPAGAREVMRMLRNRMAGTNPQQTGDVPAPGLVSARPMWKRLLFAERHGEHGTALTELHTFSARHWLNVFDAGGWQVVSHSTNGLFYTGHNLLADRLSLRVRRTLSAMLGSSCHVFVLRKST